MIHYGTNPIAWANDDDQTIGAHIPTEQILQEAGRDIGFDGIENGHRWPDDPQALKDLLGQYGLKFISGWYSTELLTRSVDAEIQAFQKHLAKLKHNGCKVCVTCETSNAIHGQPNARVSASPSLTPDAMRAFGQKMEAFATYMAGQGVSLAYHHHVGTVVETPEEIEAFLAATGPNTKLLFDSGHFFFGSNGQDPAPFLARVAARVVHFHAKNVRPTVMKTVRDEDLSFIEGVRRGVFTVPGDAQGGVDFKACLQVLADHHYSGWLVIEAEQDPLIATPLTYQTLGLKTLKDLARQTGLDKG